MILPGRCCMRTTLRATRSRRNSAARQSTNRQVAHSQKLAKSLAMIIDDASRAHTLLEKCHYDGFKVLAEFERIGKTAKDP